jgi:hypothetical protein
MEEIAGSALSPPKGYHTCVEFIDSEKKFVAELQKVDISKDNGMNWKLIEKQGFHVCRKSKSGKLCSWQEAGDY